MASSPEITFTQAFPNYEGVNRTEMSNFGVVVCRKIQDEDYTGPAEYLAVDESNDRGWWLPAGYIDPGEPVCVGTARECIEEGGIDPILLGTLRIELSMPLNSGRCRFVYFAEPKDRNQQPKDFADEESNSAEFISIANLRERAKSGVRRYRLRGPELVNFGTILDRGGFYTDSNFLITTFEDTPENVTWHRGTGCNTGFMYKTLVLYNNQLYLENGTNLLCKKINNFDKYGSVGEWLQKQSKKYKYSILSDSERVVRVWHTMKDNGAYMGFLFVVRTQEEPTTLLPLEDISAVNTTDRALIELAEGSPAWNLCILDGEWVRLRKNPAPEIISFSSQI